MRLIRVQPRYNPEDTYARLFRKAAGSQWSADDVDWEAPLGLPPRQAVALTRVLSPVYLGEQSAMYGASAVLPQLAAAGETSAQLYVASFLLDEARHFEVLTQLYQRLDHHPVALREVPEMLRYHHRLRQGDRIDWIWGILISDLFARQFYQAFAKVQPAALFGGMSARVLIDESRHQAFSHTYLKHVVPQLPPERRQGLRAMRDDLLQTMAAIHGRLRDDTEALGLDGDVFLGELTAQIDAHARSIGLLTGGNPEDGDGGDSDGGGLSTRASRAHADWARLVASKRALSQASGGVTWPPGTVAATGKPGAPVRRRFAFDLRGLAGSCRTCAVALLCRTRTVRAAAQA